MLDSSATLDKKPHFEFFKFTADDRSAASTAGDGVQRGSSVFMPSLSSVILRRTGKLTDSSLESVDA